MVGQMKLEEGLELEEGNASRYPLAEHTLSHNMPLLDDRT